MPNVYPFFADVSTKEGADSVIDFALNKLGKIDCFIANAGFAYYERLNKPDLEHNKQIFDTNVLHQFVRLREC